MTAAPPTDAPPHMPEWTPHPVIPVPTREQCLALGYEATVALWKEREERIRRERDEAFRHVYVMRTWRDADRLLDRSTVLAVFGGNGSAKTHYACWRAVRLMVDRPQAKVLFLHECVRSSIDTHQRFVYHYLPPEWRPTDGRKIKATLTTKVNYTVANGFTDNVFVLPNGSQAHFGSYKQDVGDYEGGGWSLIVPDEDMPVNWLTTLVYRLPRSKGRMLWTFTPIAGITPAVQYITAGAITIESRPAEMLPPNHRTGPNQDWPTGRMPYIQRGVKADWNIIYFFTEDNPWANYADQKKLAGSDGVEKIERRFYGYARGRVRTALPLFGAANIVPHAGIPLAELTHYHAADPAGARNMFMLWAGVDRSGRMFVWAEWPDASAFGEWAVPSTNSNRWDGEPGPAQAGAGFGVVAYKQIIAEIEAGRPIAERWVDPRSGNTDAMADAGSSFIARFSEEQRDHDGKIVGPPMDFAPARAGKHERDRLQSIADLLEYDPGSPVVAGLNEPRLYVSDRCENLIWAMRNYTARDGEKAACKDPIDAIGYLAASGAEYIDPKAPRAGRIASY